MRKITQQATAAFMQGLPFKSGNTAIKVLPNVTVMELHGNPIAYRYNDPQRTLSITDANWPTNTTKERLNSLPGVRIQEKKGTWYLNGEKWDGELIDVQPIATVAGLLEQNLSDYEDLANDPQI